MRSLTATKLGAALTLFVLGCSLATIAGGPVEHAELNDGVYRGTDKHGPNKAVVEVEISDQKITRVEIIQHNAWRGKKANPIIPDEIIKHQSTDVDAVSGATNSSRVIMNATQNAIENSYKGETFTEE